MKRPEGFEENLKIALEGGGVAGETRRDIEKHSGRPVVTNKNAVDFTRVLGVVIGSGGKDGKSGVGE